MKTCCTAAATFFQSHKQVELEQRLASMPGKDEVYVRVLMAVRARDTDVLHIKMFRHVPCDRLSILFPIKRVTFDNFDKLTIGGTLAAGAVWPLFKGSGYIAQYPFFSATIMVGILGTLGMRLYFSLSNKRTQHLLTLSTALFYRNMASNRGCIMIAADRAKDEQVKNFIRLPSSSSSSLFALN